MNVLQLISSRLGYYGAEKVVVMLAAALEQAGVMTIIGAFRNQGGGSAHVETCREAGARGVKSLEIDCRGRFDRHAVDAISRTVDECRIDVIHAHGVKPALYGGLVARKRPVALVSTCHLWAHDSLEGKILSVVDRCILHGSDRVVAVSDHILPQLRRFGLRGEVIYNGIEPREYELPVSDIRSTLGCDDNNLVIAAVGRLAVQKGLRHLLRAMPAVLHEHPRAVLLLAGDGPERVSLAALAGQLQIEASIRFLGVRRDIPELLQGIDVLAMPSIDEGLPMTLLEAMASGRAVLASAVGAVPRVVDNGVNGILVAPGDVQALAANLNSLLANATLRATLGQNARRTVESRFSAVSMTNQYLAVYRSALAEKRCIRAVQQQESLPRTRT